MEEESPIEIPKFHFTRNRKLKIIIRRKIVKSEQLKPTSKSDIFSVEVDGKIEYIELTGFTPKVLTQEETEKLINKRSTTSD